MRIIITGGTGLIGRALTDKLVADGHNVVVLSRTPERAARFPKGVQVEGWDAHTAQGWGHLAEDADAIVNLAGENLAGKGFLPTRWTEERKRRLCDSRIDAGRAVVQAVELAAHKPRVVVQASGVGYYGPTDDAKITEESPPGDDFLARLAAEDWESVTEPVERLGVRRAIVRSGAVLSMEGGALPRLVLPFRLFVGGPMGSGDQWLPWIHIADEIAAIQFLMENEQASGPFNLTAPNPVTNAEFARTLGQVMGRPSLVRVPGFAMRLAFGEVSDVLLKGQRAIPQRLLEMGFQFRFPNARLALENLLK